METASSLASSSSAGSSSSTSSVKHKLSVYVRVSDNNIVNERVFTHLILPFQSVQHESVVVDLILSRQTDVNVFRRNAITRFIEETAEKTVADASTHLCMIEDPQNNIVSVQSIIEAVLSDLQVVIPSRPVQFDIEAMISFFRQWFLNEEERAMSHQRQGKDSKDAPPPSKITIQELMSHAMPCEFHMPKQSNKVDDWTIDKNRYVQIEKIHYFDYAVIRRDALEVLCETHSQDVLAFKTLGGTKVELWDFFKESFNKIHRVNLTAHESFVRKLRDCGVLVHQDMMNTVHVIGEIHANITPWISFMPLSNTVRSATDSSASASNNNNKAAPVEVTSTKTITSTSGQSTDDRVALEARSDEAFQEWTEHLEEEKDAKWYLLQ